MRPSDGAVFHKESGAWVQFASIKGDPGPQGPTGEVSAADLNAAIGGTSNSTNGVAEIDTSGFTNPDAVVLGNKYNEMLLEQRR